MHIKERREEKRKKDRMKTAKRKYKKEQKENRGKEKREKEISGHRTGSVIRSLPKKRSIKKTGRTRH